MAKRLEKIEASQWMPAVGGRLRMLREVHGMTQLALSTAIHVDKSAWTKYEKGQLLPNPYKMLEVCTLFKVSMDYLYRGTLFGVHPDLAIELVARDPGLAENTKRILQGMGTGVILGMNPISE